MRWPRPHCHSGTINGYPQSDLCIAGVFGAGKTRSLAVLLIALSCELDDFSAVVFTRECCGKSLANQVSDLTPNTCANWTITRSRCSDRNRIISSKRILIATGGLPRRKCPCDTPPSANGCPGFGLHLWMKVSNMATIMKLLHLRPFSSLLLLCL